MNITKQQLENIIKEELEDAYRADTSQNPAHQQIFEKIVDATDLLQKHGSHPNLTDAYIALLRAAKDGGLNIKALMAML